MYKQGKASEMLGVFQAGLLSSFWWSALLLVSFSSYASVLSLSPDGNALLAFKAGLNDFIDVNPLSSWIESSATPCNWMGITCNAGQQVTAIALTGLSLSGTIPSLIGDIKTLRNISLQSNFLSGPIPPSIFSLKELQYLDLGGNYLNGSIPVGFRNLGNLEFLNLNNNELIGGIPEDFSNLSMILHLDLSGNKLLSGTIPPHLGSLRSLRWLDVSDCGLSGELPAELGDLIELQTLSVHNNFLEGPIPASFGGLERLQMLDLSYNQLTTLPPELGDLQSIQTIRLLMNSLSGPVPSELGKLNRTLVNLDLANNQLSGSVPEEIGTLSLLNLLHLSDNNLTGIIPSGLAEMPFLQDVLLYGNSFTGPLPPSLGENQPLVQFDASSNFFTGFIPLYLCQKGYLERLVLSSNLLHGPIPDSLGSCSSLLRLKLENNLLNGSIPSNFGDTRSLNSMDLSDNQLTGGIPVELGTCISLKFLSLTGNRLTGGVPAELGSLRNLTHLEAAGNNLTGAVPVELCLTRVSYLDLSSNELSGQIPFDINSCQELSQLALNNNQFSGIIPPTFATINSLGRLNLAHNNLVGPIPPELAVSHLQQLDVSFNNLTGPVSTMGFFATLNVSDYQGNADLCSASANPPHGLKPCVYEEDGNFSPEKNKKAKITLVLCILASIFVPIVVLASVCSCCLCISERIRRFRSQKFCVGNSWSITMFHTVPDLTLDGVLGCLDEGTCVGNGGPGKPLSGKIPAGKVFLGRTPAEDRAFVVKMLKVCAGHGVELNEHGFRAEVEILGNIRHDNIVKLLACCADGDTKLLVYEFLPGGSVADQLHGPKGGTLDWETRLKIVLGAGQGLSYLHHDCVPPLLHRDVKSSNILLDEDFNAKLADFGLDKLLQGSPLMHTETPIIIGPGGYIAPEFALSMKANQKSDVYSYGVVLLEMVTGRRAVERFDEFERMEGGGGESDDGEDLVTWTQWRIREKQGLVDALDKRMGTVPEETQEAMMMVLRIGLFCTNASPDNRPCMRDVVRMLNDVKKTRCSVPMGRRIEARGAADKMRGFLLPPLHQPISTLANNNFPSPANLIPVVSSSTSGPSSNWVLSDIPLS